MIAYQTSSLLPRSRLKLSSLKHGVVVASRCQLRKCSAHATQASSHRPPQSSKSTKPSPQPTDHHSLGTALNLFSSTPYSAGSPLLHPDGSHLFLKLQALLRAQYAYFGFREVITPIIYKSTLWKRSGHLDNYRADMFKVTAQEAPKEGEIGHPEIIGENEAWGLKPMNCPGHCLLFKAETRSYRDLPVRFADFSPLHRNEVSGSLSGLTRVRRFHTDDGHIFCRPDQVRDEISKTLQMVDLVYGAFGLRPHKLLLSTRPETDFMGTVEEWDKAEQQLQEALEASSMPWEMNPGDGAFYGPKIDVILRDRQGKEHQTATIQLDFQLPQRFNLKYHSPGDYLEQPILIHRAVLGSLERFLALLIEHYAGHFPLWLSPRQIKIMTLNDDKNLVAHAQAVADQLSGLFELSHQSAKRRTPHQARLQPLTQPHTSYIIDIDAEPKTLGRKAAQAVKDKWCVICTIGPREAEEGTVSVNFSNVIKGAIKRENTLQEVLINFGLEFSEGQSLEPVKLKQILDHLCEKWL